MLAADMLEKVLHIEDGDVLNADQCFGGLAGNWGRFPGVHVQEVCLRLPSTKNRVIHVTCDNKKK